jgi:hypothetical protein
MREPEITKKWIAAGKILATDPTAEVRCPVCEEANLVVMDIPIEGTKRFERIMSCPSCRARNILLINKAE